MAGVSRGVSSLALAVFLKNLATVGAFFHSFSVLRTHTSSDVSVFVVTG